MITKISIANVTSYQSETSLKTDKKVNLIYGLNGAGKTTISNFLSNIDNQKFSQCNIENFDRNQQEILVYNQEYINKTFYESETQPGIFTLSQQNADVQNIIDNANTQKTQRQTKLDELDNQKQSKKNEIDQKSESIKDTCFKIKQDYTGGDRVLDDANFLKGLKQKNKLFEHLVNVELTTPDKTVDGIKQEVERLNSGDSSIELLSTISNGFQVIETNPIMQESIVGSEDKVFSNLINQLQNSDWVTEGLKYVNEESEDCPFCQQQINQQTIDNIKDYFDQSFENKKNDLAQLKQQYQIQKNKIISIDKYKENIFLKDNNFEADYVKLIALLDKNSIKIQNKIDSPSQVITLGKTNELIEKINRPIADINIAINQHNEKLQNKQQAISELKNTFWQIMRHEYDNQIKNYQQKNKQLQGKLSVIQAKIIEHQKEIERLDSVIQEQQKKIINIDEAMEAINNNIRELGLTGFSLQKHEEHYYKIVRDSKNTEVFDTLSEGEKNIVSFLYFIEECKGRGNPADTVSIKNKIIVIDDPVSSLSHIFIFNVAQFIKNEIYLKAKQCFVLTHSLYFLHELIKVANSCELFRISKNQYSCISRMNKKDIATDYEVYWSIIRENNNLKNNALVANCMRNIIEYFFRFINKEDISQVFEQKDLEGNKFQAFRRFINRDSHSDVNDIKELDYEMFKEAFKLIFERNGYENHYKKMMEL